MSGISDVTFKHLTVTNSGDTTAPEVGLKGISNINIQELSNVSQWLENRMKEAGNSGLIPPSSFSQADMTKIAAAFEELLILFVKMAKETQSAQRSAITAQMQAKVNALLQSADKKIEAAQAIMTMAIVSLCISIVQAGISLAGAGMQGKAIYGDAKGNTSLSNVFKDKMPEGKDASLISSKSNLWYSGSQGLSGLFGATAQFVQSLGQSNSQKLQAEADKLAALAEEISSQMQISINIENDMREFVQSAIRTMSEFFQVMQKMAEASAH